MKTKIKYIAITLTIIVLVTAVIFAACKKTNETEVIISKKENAIQITPFSSKYSIGELHNICCEQILRNGNDSLYYVPSTNSINTWLDNCKATMVELHPKNTTTIEAEVNAIRKYLNDYGDNENGINKFISKQIYTSNIINEVVGQKDFPKDLGTLLLALKKCLLSSHFDEIQYSDCLYQIEETSSSIQKDYFIDIHKHSSAFWASISKGTKDSIYPPEGMTCDEWTIVMDAIGGVYGSVFGPIGSVVFSAIFSLAAARDCEERPK